MKATKNPEYFNRNFYAIYPVHSRWY